MSHVNIRLLANELKLSISTVSKALKDSHEISAETKERVLAMARKLHYSPNPYASSLRRKKSNTIAVVIPEVADSFFSLAIKGIESIAQTKGYHVLIYLTYESSEKEQKILEECRNGRVDGVLLSVASETSSIKHFEELCAANIPLIFFDRAMDGLQTARVRTNDYDSAYTAAQHLIEKGCRQIAFLSISPHLDINFQRLQGYRAALSDYQQQVHKHSIVQCTNDMDENYAILNKLMKGKERPDGVIAAVEKLITPFYLACQHLQLSLPDDVKVIGFSNLANAEVLKPSLSTITQPAFEMGKAAATILFKALEKRNYAWQKEDIILPSQLFARDSSANSIVKKKRLMKTKNTS